MSILSNTNQRLIDEYASNTTNDAAKEIIKQYASSFDFGINIHKYPSDLGNQDLKHYVEFGITVRGKSEFNKTNRLFQIQSNPDSANMTAEELSGATTAAATAAGGFVGSQITEKFYKAFAGTGAKNAAPTTAQSPAAKAIVKAAGAITGAAVGATAVNANKLLAPDTKYRISDVIALHVDGPPTVKYSTNYSTKDLGTLAGIVKGGVFDTLSSLGKAGESLAAATTAFAKVPSAFGVDTQSLLSASSKTSLNPFREVVFESVDFRSFAFKYKFFPKSPEESRAIKEIIKLFKFHMHPEMSESKLFFIYPSEFQITYYYGNAQNEYFHKFAPCALESMEVSYGDEQFSSFEDGNPTVINLSLTFRELEILTKKMIEQGY